MMTTPAGPPDGELTVDVVRRRDVVPGAVVELTLARPDCTALPSWEPGAHVDVVLPSGTIRQYSLCGDPEELGTYQLAVLREVDSRGGSVEVHEKLHVGTRVALRGPRNHFPLRPGTYTILIAGGIGITPLLPMAHRLAQAGAPFELVYGGRSRGSMAYVEELLDAHGGAVRIHPEDTHGLLPLAEIIDRAPAGASVHACGPTGMLDALAPLVASRPDLTLHVERFTAPQDAPAAHQDGDGEFTVVLARSDRTLTVPPGTRLIDVVRTVVPSVPFSCEEGYCGSCETVVLEGEPDHRDTVLSDEERATNECMMICVGRSRSPVLVLDL